MRELRRNNTRQINITAAKAKVQLLIDEGRQTIITSTAMPSFLKEIPLKFIYEIDETIKAAVLIHRTSLEDNRREKMGLKL